LPKWPLPEMLGAMPRLFVVATPIGNLEDISLRAQRILRSVALVAAEDTRVARLLLNHYGIKARLTSYNEHNRARRIPEILATLGEGDVALVSDAGTPGISDPGEELVAAARAAGFRIEAVPGPSAVITALSVAGLRAREWYFAGFLPRTAGELGRLLAAQANRDEALVAYEAPSRLRRALSAIEEALPERRLAVCRELTKIHEEVFVGTATEALAHFSEARGEIVLVIEGADRVRRVNVGGESESRSSELVADEVRLMQNVGLTQMQGAALLKARHGLSRRHAYKLWVEALDKVRKPLPRR
jgi:16S rRNA (cytidine1402-2'-O)-methyltransferase